MSTRTPVRVEAYMSAPVETAPPGTGLVEAAARMREAEVKALVVTGDPRSIVTSTDVVDAVAEGKDPSALSVAEVATPVEATVSPDGYLQEAASRMLREDVSHLPVVEGDELVGMLSKTDVTASRSEL